LPENKSSEPNPERRSDCPECERVWNAYAFATRQDLDAVLAKETSTQPEKTKILEDAVKEAAQWRDLARQAVRDHAATHAGEEPETQ
jgi:transcriptional regulator NrdR family protein